MKKHCYKIVAYGVYILLFVVINGCAGRDLPIVHEMAPLSERPFCKIAVLPFINETDFTEGDRIPYLVFMSELGRSDGYSVAQEGDIRNLYREMMIYPGQSPHLDQMRVLSDRLNVDLLISGKVVEMTEDRSSRKKTPMLALSLTIIDGNSGKILWTTYHKREGGYYRKMMHFGLINSVTALAQKMSQEIVDSWFRKGLKVCNQS